MDIISYGAASKVSKEEKCTRNDVLGEKVTSSFPTLEDRLNSIDKEIGNVTKQADKLIIQNAVNIMKSHAKLNTIAQSKKYKMHDMIFDDLLDLSGIDTANSKNYTHDPVTGVITASKDCVIETKAEVLNTAPEKVILTAPNIVPFQDLIININSNNNSLDTEEDLLITSYISRNNGDVWEEISSNKLFYFHDSISPMDKIVKLKIKLPEGVELPYYALTWA